MSDTKIEPYNQKAHEGIIYAAALEGCDVSPLPGAERFIGFGDTKYGYGAGCLIDIAGTPYLAEPHVTWFPWTTPAQRMKHFKWFMKELSRDRQIMLVVEKKENTFFEHFVKRGLLRKIGVIMDLPEVEEVHMYQYIKRGKNNEQKC